jgi:hypothetical protein
LSWARSHLWHLVALAVVLFAGLYALVHWLNRPRVVE